MDEVDQEERDKAAFLTEYRALCERHGFMVIHIDRRDKGYSPFALAIVTPELLAIAVEEMMLEPVANVEISKRLRND